jgi:hypothetical protein
MALPDMIASFGDFLPADFFNSAAGSKGKRIRLYTPVTIFWAFLFQVLKPHTPCQEVVSRLIAWVTTRVGFVAPKQLSCSTASYCDARSRLDSELLSAVHSQLVKKLRSNIQDSWTWCNRRVKVMDGTGLSMPDTAENQAQWPQPKSQKKGCGFPILKLVGLFCLQTGAWLGHVTDKDKTHDLRLSRRLYHLFDEGDINVADTAFCSYSAIAELKALGVDSVYRLHQKRSKDMKSGKTLGNNDILQIWPKPKYQPPTSSLSKEEWAALPDELEVRVILSRTERKGFRTQELWIATTLTDAKTYSANDVADLYYRRWSIELFFRDIKTTMGMDVLRCKSPAMVLKEIQMHSIAFNLVRLTILHAASEFHQELGRISFKGAIDSIRQWQAQAIAYFDKPQKLRACRRRLLWMISTITNPHRPGRREPRAVKRRPKAYPLLNAPRHEYKEIPHRSSYKKPQGK